MSFYDSLSSLIIPFNTMFRILYAFLLISSTTFHLCCSQVLVKPVNFDRDILIPRVVGGTPAKLGEFPYQLALKSALRRSRSMYHTFCGAVIIGPSKILTAAHCYVKNKSDCKLCLLPSHVKREVTFAVAGCLKNRVRYSRVDSIEHGQWRRVIDVKFPKGYKFPKYDIAVAFAIKPFVFNSNIASITYAKTFVDYSGKCVVSGFGRVGRYSKAQTSEVLLTAELELLPWSVCNQMYRMNMISFICIRQSITDVGKGDSGGPLVCSPATAKESYNSTSIVKSLLVGIVSGHRARVGSFFTRVSSYHKFIAKQRSHGTNNVSQLILSLCLLPIYVRIPLF